MGQERIRLPFAIVPLYATQRQRDFPEDTEGNEETELTNTNLGHYPPGGWMAKLRIS